MDQVSGTFIEERNSMRPRDPDKGLMEQNLNIYFISFKTIVYTTAPFLKISFSLYICSTTCYLLAIIVKYYFQIAPINYNFRNDGLEETIGTWMDVGKFHCSAVVTLLTAPVSQEPQS